MDETQNQAVGDQALPIHPPLPLPNMDDLQEQLRQKERMFQRACRAAREAELRVEHLENIIDSKRETLDGSKQKAEEELQKRLADLHTQLEGARRGEEDLSTQFDVERRRRIDAERKTDAHKIEIVEWKRRGEEAENAKEELLQHIERLKGESELARREVKDLKDSMTKKCEVHDKEKATLKEEVDNERRRKEDLISDKEKLEREIASLKTSAHEANSQLAILQAQLAELQQQQAAHTVQDRSLDVFDGEDFEPASEESIPAEGPRNKEKEADEDVDYASENRVRASSDEEEDNWVLNCICGQTEDDGEACIGCDQCLVRWEHVECIFPRTKKVPSGLYLCHVCKPRPTELTPEQARAYQDRIKMQKEEEKKKLMQKRAEKSKKKNEQEEIFEDHDSFQSLNELSMDFENEDERTEIQQGNREETSIDDLIGEERETEETLKDDEVENRRRSSRITSKPLKSIASMEDSDDDTVPPAKKSSSNFVPKIGNERNLSSGINKCGGNVDRGAKKSDTEMECPQCEYRTRTVKTFLQHLSVKHSTTPYLAGVALLCECGVECSSKWHNSICKVSNFTVIKKETKINPQKCVLCETYPKTAHGYAEHLRRLHKSTLVKNGIYLTCACGLVIRSRNFDADHTKKCEGLEYSLHKLDEMSDSLENDKKIGSIAKDGPTIGDTKDKETEGGGRMRKMSDDAASTPIALPTKKNAATEEEEDV